VPVEQPPARSNERHDRSVRYRGAELVAHLASRDAPNHDSRRPVDHDGRCALPLRRVRSDEELVHLAPRDHYVPGAIDLLAPSRPVATRRRFHVPTSRTFDRSFASDRFVALHLREECEHSLEIRTFLIAHPCLVRAQSPKSYRHRYPERVLDPNLP
jgi:hypothetical protein